MSTATKLGIVAGAGSLPLQLVDHAKAIGMPYHVLVVRGQGDEGSYANIPHTVVRLGAAKKIFEILQAQHITDLVMIGRIRRPSVIELRPDWQLLKLLPRLGLASLGDDGLLKNVAALFESRGVKVRGIHEFMPQLLAPTGVWTRQQPDAAANTDIERGIAAALALGKADVGQAVVVQDGLVLAAEAVEGTDAMLQRAAMVRREGNKGVLVKLCKPQQDKRIDMPTVGVRTVELAAAAGLCGIAVSYNRTLVDDYNATVVAADRLGLFIVGVDA